jgi:hypothetical protein
MNAKRYYEKHKNIILEKARLKILNETPTQREVRLEKRREIYAKKVIKPILIEHQVIIEW